MVNHIYKFTSTFHSQTTPSSEWRQRGAGDVFQHPLLTSKPATVTEECSNHHRSLSTLRSKGLSCSRMKWLPIYTNLPGNAIVRLPHPRSGDTLDQETFLAPFADKQTCNYDTRVLKPQSLRINNKVNGIEPKQDEMVSHIYKYTSKCHSQTIPSQTEDSQGHETFSMRC